MITASTPLEECLARGRHDGETDARNAFAAPGAFRRQTGLYALGQVAELSRRADRGVPPDQIEAY